MSGANSGSSRGVWQPYIYLVYLGILLFEPFFGASGIGDWLWTALLIALFLPAYVLVFRRRGRVGTAALWWMVLLGVLSIGIPLNTGGSVFLVYAVAAAPYLWSPRDAVRLIVVLMAVSAVLFFVSPIPNPYRLATFLPAFVFIPLIGGVQIYEADRDRTHAELRRAHDEIERIAAVAERERIARDLHDLLGHTLSVIRIKSELAARLIETEPQRARREIEDVERTARLALGEVRAAVQGYRSSGFTGEVASAKLALEASGVSFAYSSPPLDLPPRLESALAFALREAVTNVVRHARATRCSAELRREGDQVVLEVIDDGVGGAVSAGTGIDSLRERLRSLGGEVETAAVAPTGFRLRARAPLPRGGEVAPGAAGAASPAASGRLEAS